MASGVKVAEDVKKIFNEMKVVKNAADDQERIRLIVFTIDTDSIVVKETFRQKDLDKEKDVLKLVKRTMPDTECCYVLYDCHYETGESKKEELVYITWTSTNSTIKQKMLYSSTKGALSSIFKGVKHNFELHDACDTDRCEMACRLGKGILSIEGKHLDGHDDDDDDQNVK